MDKKSKNIKKKGGFFISSFISGIMVITPIYLTWYIFIWLVNLTDNVFLSMIPESLLNESYIITSLHGLGLIVIFFCVAAIGSLSRVFLGKFVINIMDKIMYKLPFLGIIYKAIQQIFQSMSVGGDENAAKKGACLVEFPCKGVWSLAFTTGATKGEIQRVTDNEMVNVYVPTTPNPTSGYLLFIPRNEIKPLNMSADDALKLIISGGIVVPDDDEAINIPTKEDIYYQQHQQKISAQEVDNVDLDEITNSDKKD